MWPTACREPISARPVRWAASAARAAHPHPAVVADPADLHPISGAALHHPRRDRLGDTLDLVQAEVEVILHREDALESIGCGRGQNRGIIAKRWSRELPQTSRVRDMSRAGAEWVMKPTEMKSGWAAA